jgi:hypothetical protein
MFIIEITSVLDQNLYFISSKSISLPAFKKLKIFLNNDNLLPKSALLQSNTAFLSTTSQRVWVRVPSYKVDINI